MDSEDMKKAVEFANDKERLDRAFDNVFQGIESGKIKAFDFPLAAGPLRIGALKGGPVFIADLIQKATEAPLTAEQEQALHEVIGELPEGATLVDLHGVLREHTTLNCLAEPLNSFVSACRSGLVLSNSRT